VHKNNIVRPCEVILSNAIYPECIKNQVNIVVDQSQVKVRPKNTMNVSEKTVGLRTAKMNGY